MASLSLKNISFRQKIAFYFLTICLASVSIAGTIYFIKARRALIKRAKTQLVSIKNIKKSQIEMFFIDQRQHLDTYAQKTYPVAGMTYFNNSWEREKLFDSKIMEKVTLMEQSRLSNLVEYFNYDEYMYVGFNGNIYYSHFTQDYKGLNLNSQALKNSVLAEVFKDGKVKYTISAFAPSVLNDNKIVSYAAAPIREKGNYLGVLIVGVYIDRLNKIMTNKTGLGASGETYLVGENLKMYSDSRFYNKSTILNLSVNHPTVLKALKGKTGVETTINYRKEEVLSAYGRLRGAGVPPLAIMAEISTDEVLASIHFLRNLMVFIGIMVAIVVITIAIIFSNMLSKPVNYVKDVFNQISLGDLPTHQIKTTTRDEIAAMTQDLNILIDGLKKTSHFAQEVGKGNLLAAFTPLSDEDILGNSLLAMRQNLYESKLRDQKRKWISEGLNKLGQTFSKQGKDEQKLLENTLITLCEHLDADLGALYIFNKKTKELEQKCGYAFGHIKYISQNLKPGEGLIGEVFNSKKTKVFNQLNVSYFNYWKRLSQKTPSKLMIFVLQFNEQAMGVAEIARNIEYTAYDTEFAQRAGNNFGAALRSINHHKETKTLLENSKKQAQELKEHENELRQNLEKLNETQENLNQRKKETDTLLNALSQSTPIVKLNPQRVITYGNRMSLDLFGKLGLDPIGLKFETIMQAPAHRPHLNPAKSFVKLTQYATQTNTPQTLLASLKGKTHTIEVRLELAAEKYRGSQNTGFLCVLENTSQLSAQNDLNHKLKLDLKQLAEQKTLLDTLKKYKNETETLGKADMAKQWQFFLENAKDNK